MERGKREPSVSFNLPNKLNTYVSSPVVADEYTQLCVGEITPVTPARTINAGRTPLVSSGNFNYSENYSQYENYGSPDDDVDRIESCNCYESPLNQNQLTAAENQTEKSDHLMAFAETSTAIHAKEESGSAAPDIGGTASTTPPKLTYGMDMESLLGIDKNVNSELSFLDTCIRTLEPTQSDSFTNLLHDSGAKKEIEQSLMNYRTKDKEPESLHSNSDLDYKNFQVVVSGSELGEEKEDLDLNPENQFTSPFMSAVRSEGNGLQQQPEADLQSPFLLSENRLTMADIAYTPVARYRVQFTEPGIRPVQQRLLRPDWTESGAVLGRMASPSAQAGPVPVARLNQRAGPSHSYNALRSGAGTSHYDTSAVVVSHSVPKISAPVMCLSQNATSPSASDQAEGDSDYPTPPSGSYQQTESLLGIVVESPVYCPAPEPTTLTLPQPQAQPQYLSQTTAQDQGIPLDPAGNAGVSTSRPSLSRGRRSSGSALDLHEASSRSQYIVASESTVGMESREGERKDVAVTTVTVEQWSHPLDVSIQCPSLHPEEDPEEEEEDPEQNGEDAVWGAATGTCSAGTQTGALSECMTPSATLTHSVVPRGSEAPLSYSSSDTVSPVTFSSHDDHAGLDSDEEEEVGLTELVGTPDSWRQTARTSVGSGNIDVSHTVTISRGAGVEDEQRGAGPLAAVGSSRASVLTSPFKLERRRLSLTAPHSGGSRSSGHRSLTRLGSASRLPVAQVQDVDDEEEEDGEEDERDEKAREDEVSACDTDAVTAATTLTLEPDESMGSIGSSRGGAVTGEKVEKPPRLVCAARRKSTDGVEDVKELTVQGYLGQSTTISLKFGNRKSRPQTLTTRAIQMRFDAFATSDTDGGGVRDRIVRNNGNRSALSAKELEIENSFRCHPRRLEIAPDAEAELFITFSPDLMGVYSGALKIKSSKKVSDREQRGIGKNCL